MPKKAIYKHKRSGDLFAIETDDTGKVISTSGPLLFKDLDPKMLDYDNYWDNDIKAHLKEFVLLSKAEYEELLKKSGFFTQQTQRSIFDELNLREDFRKENQVLLNVIDDVNSPEQLTPAESEKSMKVEIKGNELIITIEMQTPTPSTSGKTLVIASSHGNQTTTAVIDGKPVVVGLNAYIKK